MKRGWILLALLILLININIISAFEVGNLSHSIEKQYYLNNFIKGWINISLSSEPTDSLFETSFDGDIEDSISVINLLKLNNANYDCIPADCETAYVEVANSESTTKIFDIGNTNGEKVIGFKIKGTGFESVSSFSVDISSNAIESDFPQLYIDILTDNIIEWQSYKPANNFKAKNYGCFFPPATAQAEILPTKEYCNKLTLPPSPSVKIGTQITQAQGNTETSQLRLSIDDKEGNSGYCDVTATATGEIICSPANFKTTEEKEVYVCIKEASGAGAYKIDYEETNTCGYAGDVEGFDFNIYVQSAKYAALDSVIHLNDAELVNYGTSLNIEEYINDYISYEYENDCSNGCYIPIKFYGQTQTVTLSTAALSYLAGVPKSTDKIYNLSETPATITSGFQKIYLNKANFSVPDEFGNATFLLTLNGDEILSEEISVESTSPKQAANIALGKKLFYFANLKSQIESLPSFYQTSIKSILNLSLIESKLIELQQKNATAISDQDYVDIMEELKELEFPQAIATTAKADSIPFYPAKENINLEILKEIGGGNYSAKNKNKYIDAILAWNFENLETKIDFERISAINEDFESSLLNLNVFDIKIEKKNLSSNPYLIIQKLENLRFKESYSSEEVSGYVYIPITDSEMTITFSTTEEIDFINIPAFISPKISELSMEGFILSEKSKKWIIRFAIALAIILFMGFILYIILQEWYKRKYENYLFKNRNYLYNLATYIQNSKKSGIEDKEILSKLKKAGWKSEQIKYVMRKYYGKRTGMFEIPIKKIFGVFKKKEKFKQENFYQQYK